MGCTYQWDSEREFTNNIDGLDGGLLNVYDDRVYFLVNRQEKITFKDIRDQDGNYLDSVYAEDWMRDVSELSNRVYTELYRGFNNQPVEKIFSKQSQNSSLSISDDKKTIYISTEFLDYKIATVVPTNDPNYDRKIYFYNLYKSIDGGSNFKAMPWNSTNSIKQILFDSTGVYGYGLGSDRTLWRTDDGAETWKKIKIPKEFQLIQTKDRADRPHVSYDWDAFYFDQKTKTLYLSCFVHDKAVKGKGKSIIYAVPWDANLVDLNSLQPVATVENQFVTDIKLAGENKFYLLTEVYGFERYHTSMEFKNSHFIVLDQNRITLDHDFGKKYLLGAFFQGKDNLLYIIGMKEVGIGSYDDIAFISHDGGKNWREEKEGRWLQGNYFDPESNKAWAYKRGKLYSRTID
ncbi:hypothetical protein BFG52_00970 [Acinetobacter larvae]|uniref:Glycosyl hydrolase n=2 Tax=Acinetobacter larvae TaxID=1789224 RepID=A0A1B2LVT6_9GAMM|nr:hypothetical protein BFG52_00970 [Acinetobacter larvae]